MTRDALMTHLGRGASTVARAWAIRRRDGVVFGFTDHDLPLRFEGVEFRADSGLTARALTQSTGLSVDNSEAMGALTDAGISEADIDAGRFDGAEVRSWLVDWTDTEARMLLFRGTIGEIRRGAGAFHAELRGLTETLNQPMGRVYQRGCAAILGDAACGFDLMTEGYTHETVVEDALADEVGLSISAPVADRWFERGRLVMLSGAAQGLGGIVKSDRLLAEGRRRILLWQPLAGLAAGDRLRITAGCDRRFTTCREKFHNLINFRGFPHLPREEWLIAAPATQDRA